MENKLEQLKDLKETIKNFESKEAKRYWIKALKISDSAKGKLYVYFNLV